jgi:DNA repair exonuclease SbcCD ATPase subunit
MINIKNLTVKNFMSVGNVTQAISFEHEDLTLVLGENLDLGGDDSGARNGTGKTTIINALSYALYGNALTNIKKDNLINKTNQKGMLVTIDFSKDGVDYKIERGRKPSIMKFWVAGEEQEVTDDAQGDSRETQAEIERLINMSHDMFKHVVALNTYTEPFLSLRANDQRTIIEQLLGITMLSEKAEALKEQIKTTKDSIQQEEYRIKAIGEANQRITDQIKSLKHRQRLWTTKHDQEIQELANALEELSRIDIEQELAAHTLLHKYHNFVKTQNELNSTVRRLELDVQRYERDKTKTTTEIGQLNNHTCHSCGQPFHNERQQALLQTKVEHLESVDLSLKEVERQLLMVSAELAALETVENPPAVHYDSERDAVSHQATLVSLQDQLERKLNETDPYEEQIQEMEYTAIEEINYELINGLTNVLQHQEFLLKLLTSKDSFIRKRIIDQNLAFLNARLALYLDKIGLPHQVEFNNDLSVSITELGRDLDFDNLSRGERNRLILSLSWAFRDVWEGMYHPVNLLFIDELVDSGMDSSGVEGALAILKKMSRDQNKSIWLVSHKDELAGRVSNILRVVKENGFTTYNNDVEVT